MADRTRGSDSILALSRICDAVSPPGGIGAAESLNKQCEALARRFQLALVVLFGSYAAGKEKAGSDLDIAVLLMTTGMEETIRTEAVIARELWMMPVSGNGDGSR